MYFILVLILIMMSSILGLLLLSLSQVCVCQEFSWGASDYYMGWSGGYSWEQSRDKCKARYVKLYTDSDLVINMFFSGALDGIWQPLKPALRTGAWRRFFLTTVRLNRETWRSVVSCLADMISTALQT